MSEWNRANNIGEITYCKIECMTPTGAVQIGPTLIDAAGFFSFELGNPSQENTSVSGSRGTYAVIDDIENSVYRNASITCLEGSEVDKELTRLYRTQNYGSEYQIKITKNWNNSSTLGQRWSVFKIRCVKSSGVRTGYAITGNNDSTAQVTYSIEVQLMDEQVVGQG